ncbi:leucine-rich repeat domain-containing protein [Candidatus Poribacteria bacterium]|nr:leucine-rich repeat domain-containing protein [Candidatus Poribacteria bacterium]
MNQRSGEVQNAIVAAVGVESVDDITNEQLAAITSLSFRNQGITTLNTGDFSGMTGLTNLNLHGNELSSLPDGIFEGLTALTTLRLGSNQIDPFPIKVVLEKVNDSEIKAVVPTGAPFDITLTVNVSNGSITSEATTLSVSKGTIESTTLSIMRSPDTTETVTVDFDALPSLPRNHYGYMLTKSDDLPVDVIDAVPVEPEIPEVTDPEPEEPTEPTVPTEPAEPTEPSDETETTEPTEPTEPTEEVENTSPVFTDGDSTLRVIAENTPTATNIGTPIVATDENEDTLTYALGGIYANTFDIDSTSGQLITKDELDYESRAVYPVTVTVTDGTLTDSIIVVISIIDVVETAYSVMDVPLSDRTPQVREAIVDAVPDIMDASEITTEQLAGITSLNLRGKGITELKTGDLSGLTNLRSLNLHDNMLTRLPVGIFYGLTSLSSVRLGNNIIDPLPLIVSYQQVDMNQFVGIVSTAAPFNIELSVTITNGSISGNSDKIQIPKGSIYSEPFTVIPTTSLTAPTVNIGTLPSIPFGHFGYTLTKSTVCNRTPLIADAIAAAVPGASDCNNVTEVDLATITDLNLKEMGIKTLTSGDLAGMFSLTTLDLSHNELTMLPDGIFAGLDALQMVDLSGNTIDPLPIGITLEKLETDELQILVPTGAPFDINIPLIVENGSIDNGLTSIPIFKGTVKSELFTITRTPGTIGPVTATMSNITTLPEGHLGYILVNTDDMSLGIEEGINVAPEFTDGENVTLSIEENSESCMNIGTAITATDANGDTLIYSLGGVDVESFDLDSNTGQIITKAELDYETQTTYVVMVTVSDGELTDTIEVTINVTDVEEIPEVVEPPEVIESPVVEEPPDVVEPPVVEPPVVEETLSRIRKQVIHFHYSQKGKVLPVG